LESNLRNYFNSLESTLRESSPPLDEIPDLVCRLPLSIPLTDDLMAVSLELVRLFLATLECIFILPDDVSRLNAADYIVFKFLKLSEFPEILDTLFSLYKLVSRGVLGLFFD